MAKMILKSSGSDMEFETVPEGFYTARCYRIIDLGTQPITVMGETKYKRQLMFSWEIIGDNDPRMKDGRPFSVHKTLTASLHEKSTLTAILKTWRGKGLTAEEEAGFDVFSMVGQYCQVQIIHNKSKDGSTTYANIGAIVPYMGEKPQPVNETLAFIIDEPDMTVFEKLSDNTKTKIQNAPEWRGVNNTTELKNTNINDIFPEDSKGEEPMPDDFLL